MIQGLYIWACLQNLVLAVSIYSIFRSRSNLFLSLFFLLNFAMIASQYLLRFGGFYERHPELFVITEFANFSLGPVLLFYYYHIFRLAAPRYAAAHFAAPLLYLLLFVVYQCIILYPLSAGKYLSVPYHASVVLCTAISLFLYSYIVGREIMAYKSKFKNLKLNVDVWLYLLVSSLFVKGVECLLVVAKKLFFNTETVRFNSYYQPLFILIETALLLAVGYFGLKEANTFRLERLSATSVEPKAKKQLIAQDDADQYLQRLSKVMDEDKLFTNTDLDEKMMAKAIGVQPYQLSILLNKYLGKTLTEFVNTYRIEEAKRMLLDEKTRTNKMFSIAMDCGFNSESVFYTNFKKYTGTTPRQFQKANIEAS